MTHDWVNDLQSELEKFKNSFDNLLPRNPALLRKQPLYLGIKAKLSRSGLYDLSPLDILYEVWLQGIAFIERGNLIKKADAWIYTVALRTIAKKIPRKGQKKQHFIEYDSVADERITLSNSVDTEKVYTEYDNANNPQYQKVRQAIQQLSNQEQEILEATVLDGWSYAEIAEYQVRNGKPFIEPTTLRQQKSRAIKKLKELY